MSVNIFSDADIKILSKNKYIKNVSHKGITYTDDFKRLFVAEQEKGKTPRQIFEECGISFDLIGESRVRNCAYRWKNSYRTDGILVFSDSRKLNSGRPRDRKLTDKEKIKSKYVYIQVDEDHVKERNKKGCTISKIVTIYTRKRTLTKPERIPEVKQIRKELVDKVTFSGLYKDTQEIS